MNLLLLAIIGAAAGFIATRVSRTPLSMPETIALGIIGALIGGFALQLLASLAGLAAVFVAALLGALGLLWLYKKFLK